MADKATEKWRSGQNFKLVFQAQIILGTTRGIILPFKIFKKDLLKPPLFSGGEVSA